MASSDRRDPVPEHVYRTLFEQSPFSTQVFAPDGTTLRVNRAWEQLWGVSLDQMPDYNIRRDPQLIAKGVMSFIDRGFAGEATAIPPILYDPNETIPDRTAHEDPARWVRAFIFPIRSAAGEVEHVVLVHEEITEQKRAEDAQADLQRRLVALTQASGRLFESLLPEDVLSAVGALAARLVAADGCAVWRLGPAGDQWQVAAAWGVSGGFASAVIRSHQGVRVGPIASLEPIIVEDVERDPMLEERRDAYRAEGIRSMLAMPLGLGGRASGTLVFYFRQPHSFGDVEIHTARALASLAAAAIATSDGYQSLRVSRQNAELANRKAEFLARAGAAMAASLDYEETLRRVAQLAVPHIADWCGVDIATTSGTVQRLAVAHVNPDKVELVRTIEERYPTNPQTNVAARVIRTGVPEVVPIITPAMLDAAAKDEEHATLLKSLGLRSFMCVPLTAHGRTLGALTFASAESGRVYTDEDLRFARDVAYRAALAVDNARAYQEAAQANRAKDEFLAVLSHELRTPLSAILGWARMLRAGQLRDSSRARALESIERNAILQTQLVDDILDIARSLTGNLHIDPTPLDFVEVVRHAVESASHAAAAKGLTVDIDVPAAAPLVGDASRLEQVVWNLLSNAVKFTPAGGRIRVGVDVHDPAITLTVTDSGIGIAPDFLPHVFDKFRQADATFARRAGGLGLGLAIVRQIVELHGGRVAAESAGEGHGATFRVTVPTGPAAMRTGVTREPRSIASRPDALRGVDVLLVDDDVDTREMAATWLEQQGATVRTAPSAADGDRLLSERLPQVLVVDLAMPDVDGYTWLRRLRSGDSAARAIPAIAFSAHAQPRERDAAAVAGFDLHISKPADVDALVDAIAMLARRGRRDSDADRV